MLRGEVGAFYIELVLAPKSLSTCCSSPYTVFAFLPITRPLWRCLTICRYTANLPPGVASWWEAVPSPYTRALLPTPLPLLQHIHPIHRRPTAAENADDVLCSSLAALKGLNSGLRFALCKPPRAARSRVSLSISVQRQNSPLCAPSW